MPVATSLKQLEALHWVAQLGGFQPAAVRLHTTQSAVSKRIAELESILGKPLFDRSGRQARLTVEGQRVAASAQEMLALHDRLLSGAPAPERYDSAFRLGASELIGMTWLPELLRKIRAAHPQLRIELDVDHGGRLLEKLNQGRFDLALVPGPLWGRLFTDVKLRVLERCWMASPALAVPRRVLSVEELAAYPIVSQYPETVHAQLQSAWFHRNGYLMQGRLQANSFSVVGRLVLAGQGIAQLPVGYYAQALRTGQLVRLRTTPVLPNVQYFAVHRRTGAHPLAAELARLAKAECDFGRSDDGAPPVGARKARMALRA